MFVDSLECRWHTPYELFEPDLLASCNALESACNERHGRKLDDRMYLGSDSAPALQVLDVCLVGALAISRCLLPFSLE